jgi:hypothetical protein
MAEPSLDETGHPSPAPGSVAIVHNFQIVLNDIDYRIAAMGRQLIVKEIAIIIMPF